MEMFQNVDTQFVPNDIMDISSPIIGYVGALQSIRLDIELIVHIAKNMPDCNVVLVGPEDEDFLSSQLHHIPNVYFIGSRKPEELPAYISTFDVCINPQKVNEITIGNYPRKIDEYLAVGKPVVATKTDSMGVFSEHVFLAETPEEYVEMIRRAIRNDNLSTSTQRSQFAATHTWEASVYEIYSAILENSYS
ncbi:MAG: glycosyltransferase [Chitinophagaceae bacterium]|nr:MAG: glycosyltransferase [Chitinophagaceae bacterium]